MNIDKELIKGSSQIMILSVLQSEPMYGYQITKLIRDKSNGLFQLGEGTMYPVLHKLEKDKLLESYWEVVNGRRRKYYRLTRLGRIAVEEKSAEWQEFSSAVSAIVA